MNLSKKIISFAILGSFLIQGALRAEAPAPVQEPAGSQASAQKPADEAGQAKDMISVDFNEADIQSVLKILALKGNVNIVASPDVKGTVTLQLKDVPWSSAFETIINTYGFSYEKKGNIYEVLTPASFKTRQDAGAVLKREVFRLNYASLDQVTPALKKTLSKMASVESIAGTNQIVITDQASNMEAVRNLISRIDTRMPQVHIETKIIRTTLSNTEQMGIDWNPQVQLRGAARPMTFPFKTKTNDFLQSETAIGNTSSSTTIATTAGGGQNSATTTDFPFAKGFPYVSKDAFKFGTVDFNQFTLMFNMLSNRKSTKIISNPRIVVLNNQSAKIQVGDEIGIPKLERNETTGAFEISGFQPRNTGIVLNVTPHISEKSEVLLYVKPEVTKFVGFEKITDTNLTSPHFETVVAETTVLIHSGDTLVIGGLISDEDTDDKSRVPYLSNIPVAGWLFKRTAPVKQRTETIFFITVVLADDAYNQKALDEWRKSQKAFQDDRKAAEDEFDHKKKQDPQAQKNKS